MTNVLNVVTSKCAFSVKIIGNVNSYTIEKTGSSTSSIEMRTDAKIMT